MRIGTWNLAGRWSSEHLRLLEEAGCDLWLLTEVDHHVELPGGAVVRSSLMRGNKDYAAVWAREAVEPLAPIHEATAAARWNDMVVCSSILPWRSSASVWPDPGATIGARTEAAVDRLRARLADQPLPVIWGGDWNNALHGANPAGTSAGLAAIRALLVDLDLHAPTATSAHLQAGLSSIDHIAVPRRWTVHETSAVEVGSLSDHPAYVVEVIDHPPSGRTPCRIGDTDAPGSPR